MKGMLFLLALVLLVKQDLAIPTWTASLRYQCGNVSVACMAAVIDENWILTTVSCFKRCENHPHQTEAFVNSSSSKRIRVMQKRGQKIAIDDRHIWFHPEFNQITLDNNMALIKLGCASVGLTDIVSLANSSSTRRLRVIYSRSNKYIKFNRLPGMALKNGIISGMRCPARLGFDSLFYRKNMLLGASSNQMKSYNSSCKLNIAPIYNHIHWIRSVMTEDDPSCAPAPLAVVEPADPNDASYTAKCITDLANGDGNITQIFTDFALVDFTCNLGYKLSGYESYICYKNGAINQIPYCQIKSCSRVEDTIENGQVFISGFDYLSTVQYVCNDGHYPVKGATVMVCDETGLWTGNPPTCKRLCPPPPIITCSNGQILATKALSVFPPVGSLADYNIPLGIELIGELPVCGNDSQWSKLPTCRKLCNEDEVIPNANVTIFRNSTNVYRTIACEKGHAISGASLQHCFFGVEWTPAFWSCTRVCERFTVDNGTVRFFTAIAVMSCDPGFTLEPPISRIKCGADYKWGPIPTCVPS